MTRMFSVVLICKGFHTVGGKLYVACVSAVRMLAVLARTPGMFIQDRVMYAGGSQELILWGGVGHFKETALLN